MGLIAHTKIPAINGDATSSPGIDTSGANLLVVVVSYLTASPPTLSDSKSNSWGSPILTEVGASGGSAAMYYCKNPNIGTAHTFTLTGGADNSACFAAFDGRDTTSPLDQSSGANLGSVQPGSITPSTDNQLVVAVSGGGIGTTGTVDSGMTVTDFNPFVGGTGYHSVLAYIIQSTAGAINPTFADAGGIIIASFKAGSSPPATTNNQMLIF